MDETARPGPEDRRDEQRHAKVLPPVKARQGVISGRVLTVLAASLVMLALVYGWIWFFSARF